VGRADKNPISLGLKVTPNGDGVINAIRFYKVNKSRRFVAADHKTVTVSFAPL
jgi:hypothetical protein